MHISRFITPIIEDCMKRKGKASEEHASLASIADKLVKSTKRIMQT